MGPNNHVKDAGSFRETRGKAKQFTTANGRTVIVKDAFIYSNKGAQTKQRVEIWRVEGLTEYRLQDIEPGATLDRHHLLP